MNRNEFLAALGIGSASVILTTCLGCSKSSGGVTPSDPPGNIDFTLDLRASANAALLTNGGFLSANGVIVAKTSAGAYIAVQQSCTHESYPLNYQASSHQFYCNNHGATFSEDGSVINGPASRSLTVYKTQLTGTSLRIYA
ncbi:ubiquinol-cytochrome c reductase iron-sulfur subunit [Chitinophaga sp. Ak27]|uniref:QcrA and Rieske domain-containing protein n=1 Tax=Chitinophaga sp. Ak27 TaxID=2726116 RepID=UPI00145E5422|nr:Rieske 2Fe-2S domain-containing protein [Chitinophaga sp. Ak27]NLU95400.1 Rieske 2Fe-2S domain-containing protein [Chitinophaga sp. Ak27]